MLWWNDLIIYQSLLTLLETHKKSTSILGLSKNIPVVIFVIFMQSWYNTTLIIRKCFHWSKWVCYIMFCGIILSLFEESTPSMPQPYLELVVRPPEMMQVLVGSRLSLPCQAEGVPAPQVMWLFNDQRVCNPLVLLPGKCVLIDLFTNVSQIYRCFFPQDLVTSHFINLYLTMVFQYLESTLHTLVIATSDKPLTSFQVFRNNLC